MSLSPNQFHAARRNASRAKSIGAFVPGLTRKSFEKYGFSTATLLTDWSVIAGRDLARFTLPERLKWPRNVDAYSDIEAGDKGRPGATLVLRVDGPRAIEVQYQTAQIIERINAHFGYRAVAEIRFIQAPLPQRRAGVSQTGVAQERAGTAERPGNEGNPPPAAEAGLAAALARLEANMTRENQGKTGASVSDAGETLSPAACGAGATSIQLPFSTELP